MRKRLLVTLFAFVASTVAASGPVLASGMHEEKAEVKLAAAPGVESSATGKATFVLGKDGSTLHYRLHLENAENVTMAHVHAVGEGGKPGAVLVWLYPATGGGPSTKEGMFSGILAEGDITSDRLSGDWKGKPVKDLFEEIEYGTAGVAVHTTKHPKTELWGIYKEEGHGKEKSDKKM